MFNIDNIDKPVDIAGGEWVGDIPNYPGVRFKVRSQNYRPFTVALQRLIRSFGKNAANAMSGPDYQAGAGKLLAEHILLDWENAVTKDGKPAKYDRKMADAILTSTAENGMGQAFRDAVAWCASTVAERMLGLIEDAAGN